METAPAKMIRRAHTVAKIGRLMKKSTKPSRPSVRTIAQRHWSTPWVSSTDWLYGCTVNEELGSRDDDLFTGLQTVLDCIVVTNRIPKVDHALLGNRTLAALSGDVDKRLSSDSGHRQHRNCGGRSRAPYDAGLNQLSIPEFIERAMKRRFHQYALEGIVHLLRNKIDLCALN